MEPIFRRANITSISALLTQLQPVRFPESPYVTAVELIHMKKDIRRNCDLLLAYVCALLPAAIASADHLIVVNQLRRDVLEVRMECGKVSESFLRPRHRRVVSRLRVAYEEMRLAAIVVCQQEEPALIDSLTVAL